MNLRRERALTAANIVTAVRTVAGMVLFALAAYQDSEVLNFVGLGVYWALDVIDGYLARRLDQETRLGAQFDILSDRVLVAFFYFNYITWHPEALVPVTLFLFNFMVLDHYLSNQFLRWPLRSPNYFFRVDQLIYSLNWSPAGKAINSALVTLILVFTDWIAIASGVCFALLAIKSYSIGRLLRLPNPEHQEPTSPGAA